MLRITLWLLMGVFVWDFVSCDILCPDGNYCSDDQTCCFYARGYQCCPYEDAVCCPDLMSCCPEDYRCNMVSQTCDGVNKPWLKIPMVKKKAPVKPNLTLLNETTTPPPMTTPITTTTARPTPTTPPYPTTTTDRPTPTTPPYPTTTTDRPNTTTHIPDEGKVLKEQG